MKLTLPRLVVALTFLALLAMATRVSADTDTWWHLRTGQWIVEHQAVPMTDPFSFTFAGQPWRYPSAGWISEVALFWLFTRFSYAGLNLFTAGCVLLAFAFVYRACQGPALLKAFVIILAAAVSAIFWSARPQMVSLVLASVFAYVLYRYRWHNVNRLWLLPPLMVIWANSHGGFAIGFILIALTLAGQLLTLIWQRVEQRFFGDTGMIGPTSNLSLAGGDVGPAGIFWLIVIGAVCAVAVAVNPSGPVMLLYPFQTVSIGVLRDYIQEWQSPNFHELRSQAFLWLLFGTLAAMMLSHRRANLTDLVLVCGTGYLGFLAGRNVPLLALVAPPILTRHLAALIEDWQSRWQALDIPSPSVSTGRATLINWLILGILTVVTLVKMLTALPPTLNEQALARTLPFGAADFVRREKPTGPLFNSYNFGGYLSWALYPDYPIFVDGRTDLYDEAFLADYLQVALVQRDYQSILDRYGVNLVIVESQSALAARLSTDAGWQMLYHDAVADVYQRTGAGP